MELDLNPALNFGDYSIMLHDILRWLHVILVAYWLGGEWGVFNASTNVANPDLTLEERWRHINTSVMIDILPRSAIIWLMPVGFHMADNLGVSPVSGIWVIVVWLLTAVWWYGLIWQAFKNRGTDKYVHLTQIDNKIRWVVIPSLIVAGFYNFFTGDVFITGTDAGGNWFGFKMAFFGWVLIIGLYLRYIMTDWVICFKKLEAGPDPEVEAHITETLRKGKLTAYVYWVSISTIAFVGVTKFF
ncbi:hypothetical protein QGN29_03760 [Temperatibacter marinus]|uniref:Uncharacterized protein n=1 Tax=Temperatibacter marinus TaxID=1456591 RepID=A0AA52HAC8_9PROT|nr:hypothetical protein [Temperatibacter marinus]WND03487.1 hypothetical protein QGN29_03760 [Temperatibacter marinus]